MGVPGRKPKPTRLKIIEGNRGHRALPANEPKPALGAPRIPKELGREARAEWRRIVPALDRIGLLSKVDRAGLYSYCISWEQFVEAIAASKNFKANDEEFRYWRRLAREAQREVRAWCTEFGLTPSARGRMDVPGAGDGEDTDDLFDA